MSQALSSSLPNLQVLTLPICFLSGPIDPSLLNLRSDSVIRLDMNDLSSPVLVFLADFSNLTFLYLSGCGWHGAFPERYYRQQHLRLLTYHITNYFRVLCQTFLRISLLNP